jgi:4-hydroxyphenylacetate 3-monooxygenase
MGARSGNNYLSVLKRLGADIRVGDERVRDATSHPAFSRPTRWIASLYDMQMERPEAMTFRTEDGGRAGMSFVIPVSVEELRKRGRMMKAWADYAIGYASATPDLANVTVTAMAAAAGFFAEANQQFADNIRTYYRTARDRDWCIAEAMLDPPVARGGEMDRRLRIVERTGAGIVVSGRRIFTPLAPMAEELLVLPGDLPDSDRASDARALCFALPCNIPGLSFVAPGDGARADSTASLPLSAGFGASDCIAVFNNVFVPWERVFLCGDGERCKRLREATGIDAHRMHQRTVANIAMAEFMLGITLRIAREASSLAEGVEEMAPTIEAMRACLAAAESGAIADRWGTFAPRQEPMEAARHLLARLHSRLVDVVERFMRFVPAASLHGAANAEISDPADGSIREKADLLRLAEDAAFGPLALRRVNVEGKMLFGESPRTWDKAGGNGLDELVERVQAFLKRMD